MNWEAASVLRRSSSQPKHCSERTFPDGAIGAIGSIPILLNFFPHPNPSPIYGRRIGVRAIKGMAHLGCLLSDRY
jgi:hypothetical protein